MTENITGYIESGIIEEYCLGLLDTEGNRQVEMMCNTHSDVLAAVHEVQDSLLKSVRQYAAPAPASALSGILNTIRQSNLLDDMQLEKDGAMPHFVPISERSDHLKWDRFTAKITPPEDFEVHTHSLYQGVEGELMVLWLKNGLPPESHSDILESALLLQGECTGQLGDEPLKISPGSFLRIPLHTEHWLKVESERPAKLIVMRKKVA